MEVKLLLMLLFATSFCCGKEIPDFIGRLIKDLKVKEPLQVHDVVLIKLGTGNKELTDEIAGVIALDNVVLKPLPETRVTDQRIRAASVIIVVTDYLDEVRISKNF